MNSNCEVVGDHSAFEIHNKKRFGFRKDQNASQILFSSSFNTFETIV